MYSIFSLQLFLFRMEKALKVLTKSVEVESLGFTVVYVTGVAPKKGVQLKTLGDITTTIHNLTIKWRMFCCCQRNFERT